MRAWTLAERPQGLPKTADFALIEMPDMPLEVGQVRVRNRWLSVDPYMRGRMNDVRSYVPPFAIGQPMDGHAVGEVIESRVDALGVGDRVLHMAGWRDAAVLDADAVTKLPAIDVPEQAFLGQFGMPGMTAYFGLTAVAGVRDRDTVFVSAAAGAVGSTVVQLAKAKGARVIGSAGGTRKCHWVRSLGADAVIDYKLERSLAKALAAAAPDGVDVYFDNVGGDHLDAALACANQDARFAICGMIEVYNSGQPTALRFLPNMIRQRIRMQGFIVSDHMDRAGEFYRAMAELEGEGKLQREETVRNGLDAMPEAFIGLFSGDNMGKMLVRLPDRS